MNINELKRELSKTSGVDFFNPKYRDIFKKYAPDEKDAEEERLKDIGIEEETPKVAEDKVEDTKPMEKVEEAKPLEEAKEIEEVAEAPVEEIKEDEKEVENKTEEVSQKETEEETTEDNPVNEELLDAKMELALVRGGVRDEKIEPAKRLLKYEVKDLNDLGKINDLIKEYPEWLKGSTKKGYGMSVDEQGDGLTEEQRRLKQMGIDPK